MNFDFTADMSMASALMATAIYAVIVGARISYLRSHHYEINRLKFTIAWVVVWVIMFAFGSFVTYLFSSSSEPDREATLYDAIEEYGLSSGTLYPLYLGGTQNAIGGTAEAHAGMFSSSAVIDLKPTTVVNIGFERNELWWPLALPADKSPFKETDGQPSVEIWFQDQELGFGESALSVRNDENAPDRAYYEAYWDVKWSDCKMEFHNLWLTCIRTVESEKLIVSDEWRNLSIPTFFERYFDRAQINLNPEQHNVLFPKS